MAAGRIKSRRIQPLKAITLSFIILILLGTLLLMMPFSSREKTATNFVDALFTAASATTVTGLVVKDTHDYYSTSGHIIILLLIQVGGLGYMTLMSLLFIFGRNMKLAGGVYMQESMNLPSVGEISKFARNTALFVLTAELIGAAALFIIWRGMLGAKTAAEYGIFHSIAAFNNAGFDLFGGFNSFSGQVSNFGVNITIMLLVVLGGLGFIVTNELLYKLKHRRHHLSVHTQLVLTITAALVVLGAAAFFALENNNALGSFGLPVKLMASFFNTVMARTAGFSTISFAGLGTATLLLVCILMFIGASPGSTAGGAKTTTVAVALQAMLSSAKGKDDTEIFGRRVSKDTILKSFAIIASAILLIIAATIALSLMEHQPLERIAFEVVSAFSLTGLSTGITPTLSSGSKLVLVIVMFIGRVGPIALLSLFLAKMKTKLVKLPEESLPVG